MTSTIIASYITDTRFDSKQFKILEYKNVKKTIEKFIKPYNGDDYIFIKNKHFTTELEKYQNYKIKIAVDNFTNSDNEYIVYISDAIYKKYNKEIKNIQKMNFSDDDD